MQCSLDSSGRILWHRGRSVSGKSLESGEGFPKSAIREALRRKAKFRERDVVVTSSGDELPRSARVLYVKSLIILPIDDTFFLYVDSGSKSSFSPADGEVLRVLGEMLRGTLETIKRATSWSRAGSPGRAKVPDGAAPRRRSSFRRAGGGASLPRREVADEVDGVVRAVVDRRGVGREPD